ncbi:hypothetical protein WDV92_03605 [Pseudomonas syringae pv. atrofaciens]
MAGASNGQLELVIFGIVISIPIIIWGSKLVLHLMDLYPIVITLGAALLGWIAGRMAITDISVPAVPTWSHYAAGALGALIILIIGKMIIHWKEAGASQSEAERSERS